MKRIMCLIAVVALVSSQVLAGFVAVGSTHQEWYFDTNANPALPEVDQNPFDGGPIMDIQSGDWADGAWEGSVVTLVMSIPNSDIPNPYKEIYLTVVYTGTLDYTSVLPTPGGLVTSLGESITPGPGGEWQTLEVDWSIEPNPEAEVISVQVIDGAITSVVVDTICIPEPVSLCTLGVGGLLVLLRRRNRN